MDFSLPYYIYCENAVGFLAQPFNAFTSLSYWAVAFFLLLGRPQDIQKSEFRAVIAFLLFVHGFCSMFWHVGDRPLGLTFDIISALILVSTLATVLCNKLLKWPPVACMIVVITMFIMCVFLKDAGIPYLTQNGGAFLPPLFLLAFVALMVQLRNQNATLYLLAAAYSLSFGVLFRSIDMVACVRFPIGTHSLSHIMAAIAVIYIVKAIDSEDDALIDEIRKSQEEKQSESKKDSLEI